MKFATDTGVTFAREMVPELRYPVGLGINMMLPLIFLGLLALVVAVKFLVG